MKKGFTLIELLVVMFIIGILASLVIVNVNNARKTARDAKRMANLRSLQGALEAYNDKNGSYPSTVSLTVIRARLDDTPVVVGSNFVSWSSKCSNYNQPARTITDFGSTGWIPGLAPDFISILPSDPKTDPTPGGATDCYAYASNGSDYKVMAFRSMETVCNNNASDASCGNSVSIREMADRGTMSDVGLPPANQASIAVSSSGAVGWSRRLLYEDCAPGEPCAH